MEMSREGRSATDFWMAAGGGDRRAASFIIIIFPVQIFVPGT